MDAASKPEGAEGSTTVTHFHEPITSPQENDDAAATGTEIMDTSDTDGNEGNRLSAEDKSQRENSTDLDSSASTLNSQAEPKEEKALSAEDAAKYDQARNTMRDELVNGSAFGLGPRRKRKTYEELKTLSTRNYLDETVVPSLLNGMSELSRRRPEKPLEWLAKFLLREQERYDVADGNGSNTASSAEEQQNSKRANTSKSGTHDSISSETPVTEPAGGDTSA